jgi:predicted enzyme related to lactoylglutathione lyase
MRGLDRLRRERSRHARAHRVRRRNTCWVDIGTDVEGAKPFYGSLFGWEAQEAGPPEETGGYGFFTRNGRLVAGYGPQQNPGPWTRLFSVLVGDDLGAKARVRAAVLSSAIGAVAHPFVIDLDDDTLRDELLQVTAA